MVRVKFIFVEHFEDAVLMNNTKNFNRVVKLDGCIILDINRTSN